MKTFIYKGSYPVQLITKHSDGQCFVIRTKKRESTGKLYSRRWWCPVEDLEKPKPVAKSPEPKPKPGVKRAQPSVKTLFKLVTQYHQEKGLT